jgi:dolichyl-phosphate-mannose-protein mannosyltransferase
MAHAQVAGQAHTSECDGQEAIRLRRTPLPMSSGAISLIVDTKPTEVELRQWWMLAALALFIRFVIMPYGGFPVDIGTFKAWAIALTEKGPRAFYGEGFADYLPGYLYILWIIGEINAYVRFNDQAFLFALKLPAVIADLTAGWLVFSIARRFNPTLALPLSASYLFNPGIIFNSAYWGQADAVGGVFALAGLATLGQLSPISTAVLMTVGAIIKPQTAPAAIPVALCLLRTLARPAHGPPRWDVMLGAGLAALATILLIIIPFGLSLVKLAGVLRTALGVYPFSSVVAFNFWGATQRFWVGDEMRWLGVQHYVWGVAMTLVGLAIVTVWAWRHATPRGALLAAATALLVTFVLPTRIHERYLIPAIAMCAAAGAVDRRMLRIYGVLSAVLLLNLIYAYTRPYVQTFLLPGWLEHTVFSDIATRVWSAVATLTLPYALLILFSQTRAPAEAPPAPAV